MKKESGSARQTHLKRQGEQLERVKVRERDGQSEKIDKFMCATKEA